MPSTGRKRQVGRPAYTPEQEAVIRDRLVGIARKLFTTQGYEHVSVRKIAARAECSPMMLYRYFANKRALLRYIWEDIFAEVFRQCEPAVARANGPIARLRAFAHAYLGYWFANPNHYRIIFLNEDAVGPDDDNYYVESSNIVERFRLVQQEIETGMEDGCFAAGDPELFAQQFLCALQGLAHSIITIPEYPWKDREALVSGTVDMALRGLSKTAV